MEFITTRHDAARAQLGSDVVLADGWGVVAGVLPIDLDNDRAALPEQVEAQTRKVLANLERILAAAGLAKGAVAAVTVQLVDLPRLFERMNAGYTGFFAAGRLPARTCVGVTALPRGALVQMDFVLRAERR